MPHLLDIAGVTDVGRVRTRNEDSIALLPHAGVAVVADGMGGHPGGDVASDVASRTAAAELAARLDASAPGNEIAGSVGEAMSKSVVRAHEAVRTEAERNPELESMGTTLTALAVDRASGAYAVGHVGDSRAYVLRDGALVQLTRDDTWVQDRIDAGDLTPEQGRQHPYSHVLTQCLGLDPAPTAHLLEGTVEPGDAYLLCTDGLVGMLDDESVATILALELGGFPGAPEAEAAAAALVRAAIDAGGFDNVTVALVLVG